MLDTLADAVVLAEKRIAQFSGELDDIRDRWEKSGAVPGSPIARIFPYLASGVPSAPAS
jgi:hypothetical protein